MYRGKRFIAIIPARGGSKGIPRKNIIDIAGKPLIAYTIETALESKCLDRIVVSTDDLEIAEISKLWGADVPFIRPSHLATDDAKTIDVLIHTLETLKEKFDYVVLLQPTQPMRTSKQIDEAIQQIVDNKQSSLVSVEEVVDHPILYRTLTKDGVLIPLLNQNSTVRRQDFETFYKVNGLIYINLISKLSNETSLNDNSFAFISGATIDIDSAEDILKMKQNIYEK